MRSEATDSKGHQAAEEPRWERVFWNSSRGYNGYRFQDFRAGCGSRDEEGDCRNPANEFGGGEGGTSLCLCDYCPMVEPDISDDDDTDYWEGEQPILVLDAKAAEAPQA